MKLLLERIAALDPRLNAFIRLEADAAMQAAKAAEAEAMTGRLRGPLHGVPVGIKDIIDVAGYRPRAIPRSCKTTSRPPTPSACKSCAVPAPSSWASSRRMNSPSAGRASTCRGRRRAIRGTPTIIPAARRRARARRCGGTLSDGAWLRYRRQRAQSRELLRHRRPETRPMAWSRGAASSRSPSPSTMSGR